MMLRLEAREAVADFEVAHEMLQRLNRGLEAGVSCRDILPNPLEKKVSSPQRCKDESPAASPRSAREPW